MVPSRVEKLLRQVDVSFDGKPLPMVTLQRMNASDGESVVVIGEDEPVSPPVMLVRTLELELISPAR